MHSCRIGLILTAMIACLSGAWLAPTRAWAMGETHPQATPQATATTPEPPDESQLQEQASQKKAANALMAAKAREIKYSTWTMGEKLALSFRLLLLGMLVVLLALGLIALATHYMNIMEVRRERQANPPAPPPSDPRLEVRESAAEPASTPPAPVTPSAAGSVPAEIAVVVTAAVGAFLATFGDKPFRIKTIRLAARSGSQWGQAGRQGIHASHQPRRR